MSSRQTNVALLVLTVVAVASGLVAFALGTLAGRWVVLGHGVVGLAIVLLSPWKTVIARRGMARRRLSNILSLALALAAVVTIASGIIQAGGLAGRIGPFTLMQVHVGAGLVTLILAAVHARQRRIAPRAADLTRRNLLRAGGVLAASGVAYLGVEGLWRVTGVPGAERRFTGSHQIVEPEKVPSTQWLFDSVQRIDPGEHQVSILGTGYTTDELTAFGDEITTTLDCTGGWFTIQSWSGVRLDRLLGDIEGESIVVRSVTGYWRRFPCDHADRLYLATHMAGEPLRAGHGAPVRLVAPDRRGFWWVKWVETVGVEDVPAWLQPPFSLT